MKFPIIEDSKNAPTGLPGYLPRDRSSAGWMEKEVQRYDPARTLVAKKEQSLGRKIILSAQIVQRAGEMPVLRALLPIAAGFTSNVPAELGDRSVPAGQILLMYCVRGQGWCEMRDRRHRLAAGELLVVPANVPRHFGVEAENSWAVSWIWISGSSLPFFLGQMGVTEENPITGAMEENQLSILFNELLDVLESGSSPTHLLRGSQILVQLLELLSWHHRAQAFGEVEAAQKIRQSIDFMRQRLDQPLQVSALAARVNISQSHYFALFKRLTGSTPIDYFIHLRMQHACRLLNETLASVKGVAAALGYDDPFYFSRLFRLVHGIAPSEYRTLSSGTNASARGCRNFTGRKELFSAVNSGNYHGRLKNQANGEDSP